MSAQLDFCFDYLSPYAYLAWTQMPALAARHGATLSPIPVLFAGLLDAWGQKGPAEIPPKRLYVMKDAWRLARRFDVPIAPPPSHPFNPLLALRISSIAPRPEIIDKLYAAVWAGGPGVTDPETVARVLGEEGPALVAAAQTPEAKAALRAQTERAISRGVFGIPTILAGDELFWGVDSLPHLEAFLRGEDPLDREALARWSHLPATAQRKMG